MGELEIFVIHVKGDEAAISQAFEIVRKQMSWTPGGTGFQPVILEKGEDTGKVPVLPKKGEPALRNLTADDGGPYMKPGGIQEKALELIRGLHYGVTSNKIHQAVKCAPVQSAYQLCLELEKKGLIERTGTGAWKAING
jgi:hypothetical protein